MGKSVFPKEIEFTITILLVSSVFPFLGAFVENMDFSDSAYFSVMYGADIFYCLERNETTSSNIGTNVVFCEALVID